ncbi:hydrogenase-4 transcriptional activator [uncultured Thiomicrorhabdus sp.]
MDNSEPLFFANSPEAMLVIDTNNGHILLANQKARELLQENKKLHSITNTDIKRFLGKNWSNFVVFTEEVQHKGEAWSNELHLQIQDQEIQVRTTGKLIQQQPHLLILGLIPLQQLKQQQTISEADYLQRQGLAHWQTIQTFFREFEQTNSLILNAVGEGVYGLDSKGLTTFVNPTAETLLGWRASEMLGQSMHDLIHHSHCDGSHYHSTECHIYSALHDGVTKRVTNEYFWRKDGSAIPVEYTSTPLIENGEILGAVIVFRDISERKKSEQKVQDALEEVKQLKQKLEQENQYLIENYKQEHHFSQIIGRSHKVHKITQKIAMVSHTNANVLITGESGTGKELIAQAIHDHSERKDRPMIRVNCASIPKDLFESEFFGHTKGAFTGAINDRIGRFELADGGTLFLDEVGEIPIELQSKLLRVLQEQQFERIGDTKTRKVNVRIIAATNRDLLHEIQQKRFREDLYFRLNVFPIESPPLRERLEDVPILAEHFLTRMCQKHHKPQLQLKVKHIQALQAYQWPGNIRELVHVIERAVIISQQQLSFELNDLELQAPPIDNEQNQEFNEVLSYPKLKQLEHENLLKALKLSQGKVFGTGSASESLQINPTTLNSKLKKFKINKYEFKNSLEN